ncbi:MAG TPA: hypothetical protein VEI94_01760 [Candidatus Bathyarchaeia archaeon]|nr:hypothetical protein [Candidatus Bathyarchaeia archaeon]
MSRNPDCVRAAALFARLEHDTAGRSTTVAAGATRAEPPVAEAEIAWLASHLDACPHCSGDGDATNRQILEMLRSGTAGELPDDAFFAGQRRTIMNAIAAEPAPGARKQGLAASGSGRPTIRSARVVRPPARRLARYALPLAAGFALLVLSLSLRDRSREGATPLEPSSPSEVARVDARKGADAGVGAGVNDATATSPPGALEGAGEDDSWLVATSDPLEPAGELSLDNLSDDDLDELAIALDAQS